MSCYQIHFSHHDIWYSILVSGMVKYATWSKATLLLFLVSSDPSHSGPLLLAMVVTNSTTACFPTYHLARLYKFAICVRHIFRLKGHIHVFSFTLFTLRLSSPHRQNFFAQLQYCQSFLTRLNVMLMNHSNTMLPYCSKSPLHRPFSGPWVLEDL